MTYSACTCLSKIAIVLDPLFFLSVRPDEANLITINTDYYQSESCFFFLAGIIINYVIYLLVEELSMILIL